MSSGRSIIGPKADQDIEEQAYYYASAGSAEIGHRFLMAAHDTFALLATQPRMGWHAKLRHPDLRSLRVFRVKGFEKVLILYRTLPDGIEVLRVLHGSQNIEALLRRQGIE